jgi:hypothetical protein
MMNVNVTEGHNVATGCFCYLDELANSPTSAFFGAAFPVQAVEPPRESEC